MNSPARAPTWKRVLAPILDFFSVFFGAGYVYFIVGRRLAGGALWDRFFGIARPQPS